MTDELRERITNKYKEEPSAKDDTKLVADVSNFMKTQDIKRFLQRHSNNVKDNYLMSPGELKQKLATINLFEIFDFDASGALDVYELTELYNQFGIRVSEDDIRALYN